MTIVPDESFTELLVQEVHDGQETVQGLEELQDVTARLAAAAGKNPESDAYYAAVTTALSILR
jgi:hypothetical protein